MWKIPFSGRDPVPSNNLTVVGLGMHVYAALPSVKETLASYLFLSLAVLRKPAQLSKLTTAILALINKAYMAACKTSAALHTILVLQAYQAYLLKDMNCGESLNPDAVGLMPLTVLYCNREASVAQPYRD